MKDCFVIMPIGSGDAYQVYRNRYEHIIAPAITGLRVGGDQVFRSIRADLVSTTGSITRDVLSRLYRSEAVIADLTDLNPNVFYELGVRHALRSGTILIALKGTKPPFDVGDLRIIPYEDRVGGEKDVIPQIQGMLAAVLNSQPLDSPVLLAVPELSELGAVKEYKDRLTLLERERDLLRAQLEVSEKASLANHRNLEALREAVEKLGKQLSVPKRQEAEAAIELLVEERAAADPLPRFSSLAGVEANHNEVFIIIPFAPEFQPVYEVIAEAAAREGLSRYRADTTIATGSIINQMFNRVTRSGIVVADLTGRNRNVMYELGLARVIGKKAILIAQDINDIPLDIRQEHTLIYDLSPDGLKKLRGDLAEVYRIHREDAVLSVARAGD